LSEGSSHRDARNVRRDLLLGAGAFLLFALASLALLTALNPPPPDAEPEIEFASGEWPLNITLIHTNDTWGYLAPCG